MLQQHGVSAAASLTVFNRLLGGLPGKDRNKTLKRCELVDLACGAVLCEPNEPLQHAYFPLTGFISLVAGVGGHQPLEMGLIGNEGMLGATLSLGVNTAPLHGSVQGPGTALRIAAPQLRHALLDSPSLHRALNRYLYVTMTHLSHTAACAHFHEIEERLAHWLLMTHDRAHADHFRLTHEFLANMLGVRRSSVTIAAGALQDRKLIRYTRGDIMVLDRKGLEAASCGCYAAMTDDYARLLS